MKALKWIGVALGVIVLIVGAAVIVIPMLVSPEDIKAEVTKRAKEATGRDLVLGGPVNLSVFPNVELSLADVRFSNAPGGEAKDMARIDKLVLSLQLIPLLSQQVKIDRFQLVRPVIALEVDPRGRPNWEFQGSAKPAAPAASAGTTGTTGAGEPTALPQVSLGDVRLIDGTISYSDRKTGTKETVTAINVTVKLPDITKPFAVDGGLIWRAEPITVKLDTGAPADLVGGKPTKVEAKVAGKPITLGFLGTVTLAAQPKVGGEVDLAVPSVRGLAAWTGNPLPKTAGGSGLGPLAIKGKLNLDGPRVAFTGAQLALDAIKGTGDVTVNTGGAKPAITAKLDLELIDLNPYMPPKGKAAPGASGSSAAAPAAKPAGPSDWSDAPIDASGLRALDADLALTVGGIRMQEIKIGRSALDVVLKAGRMTATLKELLLYDGKANGRLVLDGAGQDLGLEQSITLTDVTALPLLKDAAGFDRLDGKANGTVAVRARGKSERQLVQTLNGDGKLKFLDGAIIGINLAAMVRNAATAFLDSSARETQKTDFAELSGSFVITNGVIKNDDLSMVAPLLRVSGKGQADAPKRTVNYRVEPKAVASLQGQGGAADRTGIAVPVIIEGSWDNPKYRPDLAAALTPGAVNKAIDALGSTGAKPVDAVKGLLGGGQAAPAPAPGQAPAGAAPKQDNAADPGKLLRGVLGN